MAESLASQRTGSKAAVKERALQTAAGLRELYPDAECALRYSSPLELLIAVILSAQCTDERVNIVTKDLFRRYRNAADYAEAPPEELEQAIRSTGFYRNKAKNIQACCQALVDEHGGEVPQDMQALVVLAGVGRKTANVVLGTAFGIPSGVVVDTHVTRLSNRLGLTKHIDAVKIEQDLIKLLPPEEWIDFSHRLIWHGRRICTARKPLCEECLLATFCPKIGVAKTSAQKQRAAERVAAKKRSGKSVETNGTSAKKPSTAPVAGRSAPGVKSAAGKKESRR